MSVRPRYFIVGDDDTFTRLAVTSFYRIVRQDPREIRPEFGGRRIRYAEIFVAMDGRRAVAVKHAAFGYLSFDVDGLFDDNEWENYSDATIQSWPSPQASYDSNVIDLRVSRDQQRIREEHNWTPAASLRDQLYDAALQKKSARSR